MLTTGCDRPHPRHPVLPVRYGPRIEAEHPARGARALRGPRPRRDDHPDDRRGGRIHQPGDVQVLPFQGRARPTSLRALLEEDLEAVLFVQDSLRALWPRLPARARRHSIIASLRALFERGIRSGHLAGFSSPDVPVAILLGSMAQLARMSYFGELARSPAAWRAELDLALGRMMTGQTEPARSRPSRQKVGRP